MIILLIECCRSHPDTAFIETTVQQMKEWETFIETASRHGVLPLVHQTLRTITFVPQKIKESLKSLNLEISLNNMAMSVELIRIMKLLESHHIPALAFKGPILSQMIYEDVTRRQYGDLDILVDEQHVTKAGSLLIQKGYKALYPLKILHNKTCLKVSNDLGFYNKYHSVFIELHWRLFREKIARHLSFAQMYTDRKNIKVYTDTLPTLSHEMLLVYLCLHGSKHAWERLEWICDIDRLVRSSDMIAWEKTLHLAKEMHAAIPLYLGLALSHDTLGTPLPADIIRIIHTERIETLLGETYRMFYNIFPNTEGYVKYRAVHSYQTHLLDTKIEKLKHLFATYIGISKNDCQNFPLPPMLSFLYIFIKPFRLLGKYIQGIR